MHMSNLVHKFQLGYVNWFQGSWMLACNWKIREQRLMLFYSMQLAPVIEPRIVMYRRCDMIGGHLVEHVMLQEALIVGQLVVLPKVGIQQLLGLILLHMCILRCANILNRSTSLLLLEHASKVIVIFSLCSQRLVCLLRGQSCLSVSDRSQLSQATGGHLCAVLTWRNDLL